MLEVLTARSLIEIKEIEEDRKDVLKKEDIQKLIKLRVDLK